VEGKKRHVLQGEEIGRAVFWSPLQGACSSPGELGSVGRGLYIVKGGQKGLVLLVGGMQ